MARRGRFSRQPRVAPSLTNTLISIAREMVAREDQTIMDAWKNGGTFDGKPVTDASVLKYWAGREKGLSQDDPNYEAIKDNILQLHYGIEQSKQDLLHVQGKISDTQYAQFFLKWAGKVPKNSEFYRTLQKDAAGLIESAKAKGRANADKAKADAFNSFVKSTTDGDIAVGNALTDAAQKMATASGLTITGDGDQVLGLLTKDIESNPDKYHLLLDSIRKVDPNWDGQITHAFFAKSISQADQGYSLIATRANKDGYATAYASAAKAQSDMASWGANLQVWPVAQSYNSAYNAFSAVWDDPQTSQADKMSAAAAFSARVNALAGDKGIDPATKNMLAADATRVLGGDAGDTPSFGSAMLGHKGVDQAIEQRASYYAQTDLLMKTTPGAYVYAPTDKNGIFDPSGAGALGIVPVASTSPGAAMVAIPQLGGQAVMAMIAPHSVYVRDPNDPNASPQQVGYSFSYAVGGKTITMYAYRDGAQANHWSLSPPWADGVTAAVDAKGDTYLTMPPENPMDVAAAIDKAHGTNLVAQLKAGNPNATESVKTYDGNGNVISETKFSLKDGLFTADKTLTSYDANDKVIDTLTTPVNVMGGGEGVAFDKNSAIAGSRQAVGNIPGVTFNSAVAASMSASPESADQVGHLAADPLFQQAFVLQTMATLGTHDMMDPRIAEAWSSLTQHDAGSVAGYRDRNPEAPARTDLMYPGAPDAQNPAYAGSLTLNFGGQSLKVPNLPSYLGDQTKNFTAGGTNDRGSSQNGTGFLAPVLGIPNPTAPTGSPASTAGKNVITPTGTIAPTPAPTGVVTPAGILPSTSSPTPITGTSTGGGGGGKTNKAL